MSKFIKRFVIALVALNALLAAGVLLLSLMVDRASLKSALTGSFRAATGFTLEVQDEPELVYFPLPHVTVRSLYVLNAQGASSQFMLTAKSAEMYPSYASLLRGRLELGAVNVHDVTGQLERLKNGQMNWQAAISERSPTAPPVPPEAGKLSPDFALRLSDGDLEYNDNAINKSLSFKNIAFAITSTGGQADNAISLTLEYNERPFALTGRAGNLSHALGGGSIPLQVDISSGKSTFSYKGDIGVKDEKIFAKGFSSFKSDDVSYWLAAICGDTSLALPGTPVYAPLAADIRSSIDMQGDHLILSDIVLGGPVIAGKVQAEMTGNTGTLKADIDSVDIEAITGSRLLHMKLANAPVKDEFGIAENVKPSLSVSGSIRIKDAVYNSKHIKDAALDFDASGDEVVVSRASADLPGGRMMFTGIGKQEDEGFSLSGPLDVAGSDFVQAASIFKPTGFAIAQEDFRRFRLNANMVLSNHEMRFSELRARIENMGYLGGVIVTFDKRTRVQAALRIGGVNLDHLTTLWGLEQWEAAFRQENLGPKQDEILSQWLKRLGYDIALNASLEQYVFNGKIRDKADFKLNATEGRLDLSDIRAVYNGTALTGSASLNVMQSPPRVTADITADTLDTDTFLDTSATGAAASGPPPAPAPLAANSDDDGRWSHKGFDFHFLELLTAKFHLRAGHFKCGPFEANAMDMQGGIDNRTLTVDSFTGVVLESRVGAKIVLTGGKIPTISIGSRITDLAAGQLVRYLPMLDGVTGLFNLQVTVSTSGIDLYSWVANLSGSMSTAGRNIVVHGFNLPRVIQSVAYVRTVADILDVVRHAFPGGDTAFSKGDGEWLITNGVLKTADMQLANEQAKAQITAEADFLRWKLRSHVIFTLRSLDPLHPPTMAITIAGTFDKVEKALDTHALEQYVTYKTSNKLINSPPQN